MKIYIFPHICLKWHATEKNQATSKKVYTKYTQSVEEKTKLTRISIFNNNPDEPLNPKKVTFNYSHLKFFTNSTFFIFKDSHFDILFPVNYFKTFPADHCARAKQAVSGMQFALSYSRFRMQRKLLRSKNKRSSENLFGNSLDMISILMGQILWKGEKQKLENDMF